VQNFAWMVWTDHAVVPVLNDTPGLRLYADGARIAIFTTAPAAGDQREIVTDLRRDELRGVVLDPARAPLLAEKQLWFGLLQGALEHEALAEYAAGSGGDVGLVATTSSRLTAEGVRVHRARSVPPQEAATRSDGTARLSASLAAGHIAIVPSGGAHAGYWWELLPGTGAIRAVGPWGLHRGDVKLPKNPLRTRIAGQQNAPRGPKAFDLPDGPTQKAQAQRAIAEKQSKELAKSSKERGGSDSTGYAAILITIVLIASIAALVYVGYRIAVSVYEAAEALSEPV
jgi:hypothetical protein